MKLVIHRVSALLAIGLVAFSFAEAQSAATVTQSPAAVLAGLIDPAALPANFVAGGVGIQSGSNFSGSSALCHAITSVNYLCARSRFSGSTTADTVELKQVVFARSGLVAAINADAGAATGANGGVGGAYAVGGSVLYNISRLPILKNHPGLYIGMEGDWDKRDVQEFTKSATLASLRPFVTKGTYDFFVGYAWGARQ